MKSRCLRLLTVLMVGALLGACSSPDPKAVPRMPAPEAEPSSESQAETRTQSSDEQTAKRQESAPARESKPSTPEPQAQEPDIPEAATAGKPPAAPTDDEVIAILDRQLEEELRKYDEQIHEEFEKAQAERPAGQAEQLPAGEEDAETGLEDGAGHRSAEQAGTHAKAEPESPSPEAGGLPDRQGERAPDSRDKGAHGAPLPSDLPSGDDDDVVARQLREAAQKEQDPVLREKLWDEYRKYKRQQASVNTPPSGAEY